jgi:hypothetical protein
MNDLGYIEDVATPVPDTITQPTYSDPTTQITDPADGQTVFNSTSGTVQVYTDAMGWVNITFPAVTSTLMGSMVDLTEGQAVFNSDSQSAQCYSMGAWRNIGIPAFTNAEIALLYDLVDGQMIYNSSDAYLQYYAGGSWHLITGGGGGGDPIVRNVSADYIVTATDNVIVCDATANDIILTLPATNIRNGRELMVIKVDTEDLFEVHVHAAVGEHVRTRTDTDQILHLQDDRVDMMPISSVGMWYLK